MEVTILEIEVLNKEMLSKEHKIFISTGKVEVTL